MGAVLSSSPLNSLRRDNKVSFNLDAFSSTDRLSGSKSSASMGDSSLSLFSRSGLKNSFLSTLSLRRLNIGSLTKKKVDTPILKSTSPLSCRFPDDRGSQQSCSVKWWDIDLEDSCEINNNNEHYSKISSSFSHLECKSLKKCSSCQTLRFDKVASSSRSFYLDHRRISEQSEQTVVNINNNIVFPELTFQTIPQSGLQADTTNLLHCIGYFLCHNCPQLTSFQPGLAVTWVRSIDRSLILQGWAEVAFVSSANVVFLFMLIRDFANCDVQSEKHLRALLQTCLYVAYAYMGNEISYPLKPFLLEEDRGSFWDRCLNIVNRKSTEMLRINADPFFFTEILSDLKFYIKYL